MEILKKMKRLSTTWLGVLKAICIAIGIFVLGHNLMLYDETKTKENMNEFYKQGFSTIVVSSNRYLNKSTEFHLKNGLKVYMMLPLDDKIIIGDSIQKQPNTFFYKVFRKNEYKYYLFGIYNFENPYLNHKME